MQAVLPACFQRKWKTRLLISSVHPQRNIATGAGQCLAPRSTEITRSFLALGSPHWSTCPVLVSPVQGHTEICSRNDAGSILDSQTLKVSSDSFSSNRYMGWLDYIKDSLLYKYCRAHPSNGRCLAINNPGGSWHQARAAPKEQAGNHLISSQARSWNLYSGDFFKNWEISLERYILIQTRVNPRHPVTHPYRSN